MSPKSASTSRPASAILFSTKHSTASWPSGRSSWPAFLVAWPTHKPWATTTATSKSVFYSAKYRLVLMHSADLFQPKAVSEADIMKGPEQDKKQFQLHYNDKVICDFATPGSKMGGKTPKFACKITRVESVDGQVQTLTPDMDEEAVKVKFGPNDNEVYAEVVSTRLMWALGYYADSWFPVRVECHNCPENPI